MVRMLSICGLALLLAGCGESGNVFGFDRSGPDEFTVVRHAPLSVPPDASLRPPRDGTARETRNESRERAHSALMSDGVGADSTDAANGLEARAAATGLSVGELALARRAAAYYGVEPEIRQIVDEETTNLALGDESFLRKLLFWQDPESPGTVLDADAEARRLRENEALGKPMNSGEAPVIVRRKSGVSSLF